MYSTSSEQLSNIWMFYLSAWSSIFKKSWCRSLPAVCNVIYSDFQRCPGKKNRIAEAEMWFWFISGTHFPLRMSFFWAQQWLVHSSRSSTILHIWGKNDDPPLRTLHGNECASLITWPRANKWGRRYSIIAYDCICSSRRGLVPGLCLQLQQCLRDLQKFTEALPQKKNEKDWLWKRLIMHMISWDILIEIQFLEFHNLPLLSRSVFDLQAKLFALMAHRCRLWQSYAKQPACCSIPALFQHLVNTWTLYKARIFDTRQVLAGHEGMSKHRE